jgi:hypothetical protein
MSRSQPTVKNPATKFLSWAGGKGNLVHWDKEESKEIEEKLPFTFMVLDELTTIAGYSDEDQSGFWSNEVRSTTTDELTVRTSKGIREVGNYKDIKDSLKSRGAKYAKSVYIAYKDGDHLVMGNFKVYGAALTAWIDLSKKANVYNTAVVLKGKTEEKKGATTYFVPVFETTTISDDTNKEAIALDVELQKYLSNYFAVKEADNENVAHPSLSGQVPIDAYDGLEEEPVDISNIPF